ncbi:MAG: PAS domain-containing protein [Betaproteobacteria bacterium]|nr:PAS domain-containing protein [Betaproteobacteria bacterium]
MSHLTEAFNWNVTQQNSHLFSERDDSSGEALAHSVPFAAMVLDKSGTVCYCHADAARLFHASAHTLVGRHVRELIPDLPFKPRTPGYNVAYAAFWANEGAQHGFCGVDSQGRAFGIRVALDRLELEKRHQILLRLQLPVESAQLPRKHAASGNIAGARTHRAEIPDAAE